MTGATGTATVPAPKTGSRDRLIGFDGMRGVLALSVILVHTLGALAPVVLSRSHIDLLGQVIVVFFAMSGFLIYWPFATRIIDGRDAPSLRSYYLARVLRVYPAYVVIFLFANYVLAGLFLRNAMESMVPLTDAGTGTMTDPLSVLLHLTLLQNYFPSGLQTGINSSWTLTVEITFYALLPLLAWGGSRLARGPVRNAYLAAALPGLALFAFGLVMRGLGGVFFGMSDLTLLEAEWGANWLGVFSRSFLVWSDNFGVGMVAVVLFIAARKGALTHVLGMRLRTAAIWVTLLALLAAGAALVFFPRYISSAVAVASGAFFLAILLPSAKGRTPKLATVLDVRPLHYIGLISLSTYLWHYPVLLTVIRLGWFAPDTPIGAVLNFVLVAVLSVAISSVTYWLIERPAQRLAARKRARTPRSAEITP